jgi:hypothetical protein
MLTRKRRSGTKLPYLLSLILAVWLIISETCVKQVDHLDIHIDRTDDK